MEAIVFIDLLMFGQMVANIVAFIAAIGEYDAAA